MNIEDHCGTDGKGIGFKTFCARDRDNLTLRLVFYGAMLAVREKR